MTLLGLVELSHTPKRAVRGLVLSVFACPRACAEIGPAERIATMKTPAAMKRLHTRIGNAPFERSWNTVSIVHLCSRCDTSARPSACRHRCRTQARTIEPAGSTERQAAAENGDFQPEQATICPGGTR